jgi:soluble lytic murein transglycosylase-like protein
MFAKLKSWYFIIILGIMGLMYFNITQRLDYFEERLDLANGTISLQMYESIEHWSDSFNIPKHIAYNVAYLETHYQGPFDFNYNPYQESNAGAVGPMQIITRWARPYVRHHISEKELKTNVDLNIKISMQMLSKWYSIHNDWTLACGAYNSGSPIRNEYAIYATTNKDYKNKWTKL